MPGWWAMLEGVEERPTSVWIEFDVLWTYPYDSVEERWPLSRLPNRSSEHVHGELRILIGGRLLPALGYFGPDDVCLNEWARELNQLRGALLSGDPAKYVYDEGEQGQPAYVLRREGDVVFVSVKEGAGGGRADPEWQDVPCQLPELVAEIDRFERALRATLLAEAGDVGERWCNEVIGPADAGTMS